MSRIKTALMLSLTVLLSGGLFAKSLHPDFQLLDDAGNAVQNSDQRISAQNTCGECHSTSHINDTISDVHKRAPDQVSSQTGLMFDLGEQPNVAFAEREADCLSCHQLDAESDIEEMAVQGWISADMIRLGRPTSEQCGSCHVTVHNDINEPFTLAKGMASEATLPLGHIFSGQKISQSGLNISGKNALTRSFDVHAERVVECVDCHGASNNPAQVQVRNESRPDHLIFDPRRLDTTEYLAQPSHDFHDVQRACIDCHESDKTHQWLPYAEQHFSKLSCESCHIPELFAPAAMLQDWSSPTADGPTTLYRGIDGSPDSFASLVTGFTPLLLPDDEGRLSPVTLVSVLHWRDGDRALSSDEVFAVTGGDVSEPEAIKTALTAAGYDDLTLQLDVLSKPIHHNVTEGKWVTSECRACHEDSSLLLKGMTVAAQVPEDTVINLRSDALSAFGDVIQTDAGEWVYHLNDIAAGVYVLGGNTFWWVDAVGLLMVFGVLGIAGLHGTLRFLAWRKRGTPHHHRERVYIYTLYERLWHWLQALVILLLIGTGAIIHRPDLFGAFSFPYMVQVHNVLAFVLVVNAVLALFYNLSSGHIRQFLPMPNDLFVKSFIQLKFYTQGIFKGQPHPFEKTVQNKLNPMQKVAYFGLLNLLLPAQVITGALMWGAQRWPDLADRLGGLLWLGPIHSLLAWAFLAFIFIHIYLTTTSGPKPLSGIKAMVEGWEDVEVSKGEQS